MAFAKYFLAPTMEYRIGMCPLAATWLSEVVDRLARARWSYVLGGALAAEPAALVGLGLAANGRSEECRAPLNWLARSQAPDGSVGAFADQSLAKWPTGLAILAWVYVTGFEGTVSRYQGNIKKAVRWLISTTGTTQPKSEGLGHDTTLAGWPWIQGTHSWIEPTAWSVLALKAVGYELHARTREAVALLIDRLLPDGGCNYGNTTVLGNVLRPQIEPTGLALAAIAGERDSSGRIAHSLAYLKRSLSERTPAVSLAYGLLGLAAHSSAPAAANEWLEAAAHRVLASADVPLKLALLALAAGRFACVSEFPSKNAAASP